MSPSVHRADKSQFNLRLEKDYKRMMQALMARCGDENMTELLKRLILEAAKKEGLK